MRTEQELARLCTAGDREAQGELYVQYASRLYALCYRYVADREEAQDLMHDAMIRLWTVSDLSVIPVRDHFTHG